jgi:hypothetical protein
MLPFCLDRRLVHYLLLIIPKATLFSKWCQAFPYHRKIERINGMRSNLLNEEIRKLKDEGNEPPGYRCRFVDKP